MFRLLRFRSLLFGLFGFLVSGHLLSQDLPRLTGRLADPDGKALPFVNLVLRRLPDSTVSKIGTSDVSGMFSLVSPGPGRFYLETGMVGYTRLSTEPFNLEAGKTTDLGSLVLRPSEIALKEVQVTATRSMVQMEPDKLVVRVADNPLMINNNALEVLRKSPGVMVNQDDQIFILGKSGVQVYIDGRLSPLSGQDLANWLRGLNSSQIESIEVITNPSSKYDAAGNAGILNIRLKKDSRKGLNGGINSGLTHGLANEHNYLKTNQGFSLNYGTKKVNLFSTFGYDYGKSWSFMDIYREQKGESFDQKSGTFDTRNSYNLKLGADWTLSKRHLITFQTDGNLSVNKSRLEGRNQISRLSDKIPYSTLDALNLGERENATGNISLGHQYKDTSGRELNSDFSYGYYNLANQTNQPNFYRDPITNVPVEDRSFGLNTPVDIRILTVKSDYEQKAGKSTFAGGFKVSDVLTDNTFDLFNRAGGKNDLDPEASSRFQYTERVSALYGNWKYALSASWSFQGGLRYEHTYSRGLLQYRNGRRDSNVVRRYGNLFPSAGITWKKSKNHSFTLSYSLRVDRPVYRFLNPFQYKLDELSYEQGNPFLNPQYTHNIQLGHSFMGVIFTTAGYSKTLDFFARVIDSAGRSSFLTRRNLANVETFSLNLSSPLPIKKWWNGFLNFTLNRQHYEADFGPGRQLSIPVTYWNLYLQQSFTLPKGWGVQGSGSYSSPNVWGGTFRNRAFWFAEVGFTKKVLKKKGTLSLTVTDLFRSMRWAGRSDFAGVDIIVWGGNDSRSIRMGFSWNFGRDDLRQIRRKTGNQEERQRLRGD